MQRILTIAVVVLLGIDLSFSASSVRKADTIDLSKSIAVSSRIPCDGYTAPQDHVLAKATFSGGSTERSFTLSEYQNGKCKVNLKIKCVDKVPTGWRQDWIGTSGSAPKAVPLALDSCYEWGSKAPAQYVVSGWYKPAGATKKTPWTQATVKRVSTNPDVYEFSDDAGGTGRLELSRP